MRHKLLLPDFALAVALGFASLPGVLFAQQVPGPGSRTVMDAHNCYPYFEWWGNRIDRALSTGVPLAIEQDLGWYTDPKTGRSWSVVTHGEPLTGEEPTMDQYFFARVRPIVEQALKKGNHGIGRSSPSIWTSRTTSRNIWQRFLNCCAAIRTGSAARPRVPTLR
jgi:hypothetical protein